MQKETYIKYYLETIHNHSNNFIGKSFNLTLNKDSNKFYLNDICQYPCLIVFLPNAENTCMSCIDYAISSINHLYPEFTNDSSFIIISEKYHPDLKERIIRKKIYYLDELCNDTLEIKYDLPVYFLIDENLQIISSFIPNGDINTRIYVERYLKNIINYIYESKQAHK